MLTIMFESPSQDRISDFEMKLMDIDAEQLGIPDQEYACNIRLPSSEFQRIIRDLGVLGDTCTISVTKEGVKFSVSGDLGTGNVMLRNSAGSAEKEALSSRFGRYSTWDEGRCTCGSSSSSVCACSRKE